MSAAPVDEITLRRVMHARTVAYRMTRVAADWEDVAQESAVLLLRGYTGSVPQVVVDALRSLYGWRYQRGSLREVQLVDVEHDEDWPARFPQIASLYPTERQRVERWERERVEDENDEHAREWARLSGAERSERAYAAALATGTSPPETGRKVPTRANWRHRLVAA